jgi:voltage-gated sodium channel type II alpha
VLSDLIAKYFVSPTLLRVVRVAKIGRVLRLVKGARGIRTLLFALAMSMPALFNICLLLFLVMFIFAIFGMSFFMNVKHRATLDSVYNFETFGKSMILLFQISTSAGWDGVLNAIMDEEDCQPDDPETGEAGNCGNTAMAISFMLCYLVISFLIIINMYIAVILENYSQATEDVQEGLTDDDYDMYYEIWQQFDPDGTRYLKYSALSDFLDVLEPPLQIHKPNKYKLISMDIPICKGDLCYCVDVLDALTKDFFARKGNPVEETAELGEVTAHSDRPGYDPISSTLWRQREDYCARLIQNAWRRRTFNPTTSRFSAMHDLNEEDEFDDDEDDERTPLRSARHLAAPPSIIRTQEDSAPFARRRHRLAPPDGDENNGGETAAARPSSSYLDV